MRTIICRLYWILLLALPASATHALELNYKGNNIAVIKFLDEVQEKLPPAFKTHLRDPIYVRFGNLPLNSHGNLIPQCLNVMEEKELKELRAEHYNGAVYAHAQGQQIILNKKLLEVIEAGQAKATSYYCGHGNLYRLAQATLIHEIGHLYDAKRVLSTQEQAWEKECKMRVSKSGKRNSIPAECFQTLVKKKTSVSTDAYYKDLAGWKEGGMIFKTRSLHQTYVHRSPDLYEYYNLWEHFAVNFEYFLLDPEYACRRPLLYDYLKYKLDFIPFPYPSCQINYRIQTDGPNGQRINWDFNPKNVYQIHYLFAGEGEKMMSNWGHAMYRIIACDPKKHPVPGPECLNDISMHAVVGYAANIPNHNIGTWKGLAGKYTGYFVVEPLSVVTGRYNTSELRDVISLPLNFDRHQINKFMLNVLDNYWEYRSKYYFLTNNCATEARNLLSGVISQDQLDKIPGSSPWAMYRYLINTGIADSSPLKDCKKARELGYFWPSQKEQLESIYDQLRKLIPELPEKLKTYQNSFSAEIRFRLWLNSIKKNPEDLSFYQKVSAKMEMIEKQIYAKELSKAEGKVFSSLESNKAQKLDPEIHELYQLSINQNALRASGSQGAQSSYGIPLADEVIDARGPILDNVITKAIGLGKSWIGRNFSSDEIKIDRNLSQIMNLPTDGSLNISRFNLSGFVDIILHKWSEKTFPEQVALIYFVEDNLQIFHQGTLKQVGRPSTRLKDIKDPWFYYQFGKKELRFHRQLPL